MTDHERKMMEKAVELASKCQIKEDKLKDTPKVGAVIDVGGEYFYGQRGEDDHAEKNALSKVDEKGFAHLLSEATVYTTLEPCTKHVRRKPRESCTERLIEARVKKVFVGILDPNQGVCGKGVLELQAHNIEVALFPHDLAEKIRVINSEFVRAQQSLGIEFISPTPDQELHTYKTKGKWTIKCSCRNPPDDSVYVLMHRQGSWWPQRGRLRQVADTGEWETEIHFGTTGRHAIHIVKASELGSNLISYYMKVIESNMARRKRFEDKGFGDDVLKHLWSDYLGILLPVPLPKGLDTEAVVEVEVVPKPSSGAT